MHVALDRPVVLVEDAHAIATDLGGIALFQENDLAGGRDHRRDVGGNEVLALAQADQQRAAHARADEALRLGAADHGQRVGAGQFLHRVLQRHQQVVAILQVVVDQVCDDFGIGLRLEGVAQRAQLLALLFVVLDDTVVHQRHALADVRMRIGLGDTTVGGPAGMADAQHRVEALGLGRRGHFRHSAGTTHATHLRPLGMVDHRDTRGIVTTVLKALQTLDQHRHYVAISDRTHDSTHVTRFLEDDCRILACVSGFPLLSA